MSSFSVTIGNCLPCCSGGSMVLSCRTRGGTATLCGYSEWTSPSTPPKKYRQLDQGGAYTFAQFSDSGCSVSSGPDTTCTWTGTCSYNSSTCVLTSGGTQDCGGGPGVNCGNLGGDYPPGGTDTVTTQTRVEAVLNGICRFLGGGIWYKYTAANQYAQLSVEDTDADAITRLLAGAGGTWSNYVPAVAGLPGIGQCLISDCCRSSQEIRTAGFSLAYQEAGFKVELTGAAPSTNYTITVDFYRSVYGANSYSLAFQNMYSITTDGSGAYTLTDDVPVFAGYDTYAANPVLS